MARRNDGILDLLVLLPWWISVLTAGIVYVALAYIAPDAHDRQPLPARSTHCRPEPGLTIRADPLIPAPISAFNAWRSADCSMSRKTSPLIRSLSWKQFEELVAEAYRRQEFRRGREHRRWRRRRCRHSPSQERWGNPPRSMQKQWRSNKVGVNIVREMFGVMTAQEAASVIIVTSGHFTREAQDFAAGKPIQLVDGPNWPISSAWCARRHRRPSRSPERRIWRDTAALRQ